MLSPTEIMLVVLLSVAVVLIAVFVAVPQFKRKGVDVDGVIDLTKRVIAQANKTMDTIRPFLPEGGGLDVFAKITAAATVAVGNAEKLAQIGQLPADQREDEARKYMFDALALAGIEITPEIDRLIDGAIVNAVRLLPKTNMMDA